ncbi:hypothetical protein ABZZ79_22705 [Streptomyces sp. NPDC006458]|uniref:hypothetical protein n=1 Tax=Streptomyces TaxID=1883 RepID=UPI0029B2A277|nr:hypothetical protein [Streptomyces scabiei]MDX3207712.1 hypothetical protein [Streptomyces scabiei]
MDDRCAWCGAELPGGRRRRYCPRPRSCRQEAYRERRRAAAALRARIALLQISREIRARCEALELLVADAVGNERADAGLHSTAAADFRHLTSELVRCAVIADREVSATWEQIGRPHGLSADAARARYGRARLLWPPPRPE